MNRGFVVKQRPQSYPVTKPQQLMSEAAKACGIHKGITRAQLVDKMVNCVPEFYKERRKNGD